MRKYLFVWVVLIGACADVEEESAGIRTNEISYAKGFHFENSDVGRILAVNQPWPNATKPIKYSLKEVPKKIICTSTSHLPYLEMLESESSVIGFPNLEYISSETFIQRAQEGKITDLGPDGSINMELLMGIAPDAVIAFDMGGESQSLDKIQEAGIPVYYNSDFLEQTPLGRAEWIKFFGALLGKQQMADSIFRKIESGYLDRKSLASQAETQPTILSGVVYGDTWFLPGGNNWSATFFQDAGGYYLWQNDTTSGWKELSFESVYDQANEAEYWIGTSTINSKNEMLSQDSRYADFSAFKGDQVFNYNKRMGPNGGYDFFESGYSRPDLVLSDLIKILHPDLLPNYETVYFQRLE